jgi:hypothetical protein
MVKLAEALLERKSLMERIEALRERLQQNVVVQEGDTPSEQPKELLAELNAAIERLEQLVVSINNTNNVAALPDGTTVSVAIVRRDMLKLRRESIHRAAEVAGAKYNRYARNEIRLVSTVNPAALRKDADELARRYRELDAQIQAVNWSVDLVE